MAGMGPAPKHPDRRARGNKTVAMTRIPAEGRKGRAPAWPLGADVQLDSAIALLKLAMKDVENEIEWSSVARERSALRRKRERMQKKLRELEALRTAASRTEKEIWKDLWRTPQAVEWERLHWTRDVAQYARHKAKAEAGEINDAKEARQLGDRLGLTPLALLRLRWEIVDETAASTAPTRRSKRNQSRYGGLKVVGS